MSVSSGRPGQHRNKETAVRERLLSAARQCFLEDEYHRVPTRRIAERANTTIAMIRYYFSNKEGLYQEMIKAQTRPVLEALKRLNSAPLPDSLNDLFGAYYRAMVPNPEFPILMMKTLSLKQGPSRDFIIRTVVIPVEKLFGQQISRLQEQGRIDPAYDPNLLRISIFSLMVMPMIARPMVQELSGDIPDLDFYLRLAAHNSNLLSRGAAPLAPILTENPPSDTGSPDHD